MTEETAQYDAGTASIALPTLTELFAAWERGKLIADAKTADAKNASAYVDQVRALIQQQLQADGLTSTTDAATGINARIQVTKTWQVTDREALAAWAESSEWAREHFFKFDERSAIDYSKTIDDPLPGIELVASEPFLKITPAKGGK